MERACPRCGGLCGSEWTRAVDDSRYEHIAHWVGACHLASHPELANWVPAAGTAFEWWLDDAALPEERWICLIRLPQGGATLVDGDADTRAFDTVAAARAWLREDECDTLSFLKSQGDVARDAIPPTEMIERIASSRSRDGLSLGQSPTSPRRGD
jgi:hypothetical protein